jgi:membrane protease YdiL (CAAX protease family)
MSPETGQSTDAPNSRRMVALAIAFEAALGVAGYALASAQHVPLALRLEPTAAAFARGAAYLAPMLVLLAYFMRSRAKRLVELRRMVAEIVGQLFGRASWLSLLAVSAAAGIGEEVLFRGALQPLVLRWTDPWLGVAAVSLFFGLLHAASWMYFLIATLMGAYLGFLTYYYDDLIAPIVVHAGYDFAAIVVLRRAAPVDAAAA